MRRLCLLTLFLFTIVQISAAEPMNPAEQGGAFTGWVYETVSKSGIPDLTVKLTSPRSLKEPEKVTTTDENGKFRFTSLREGKYLLEVYQGLTLLYMEIIDLQGNMQKEIALKRR